ncbi:MAG: ABC transporter permease [Xanthomonadales bacterium]|nr:ABC transporter permease [Gammaproteobacteria bacterium]MBT8055254.1 ABC transporter permease [Gammaproteobacteria bacterium]NND55786.1 ABC transporter permease [Xanthomonadales bacterium]NNK50050.1 ABC transporter permease [Xanthomonadales bacterium]
MKLLDDVRYAIRMLSKSPGFSALTLTILSLGLGASIFGFAVLHAIVLKPLPFSEPHELMHIETAILERDIDSREVNFDDFSDWREMQTSFEDLGAFYRGTVNIRGSEKPERYDGGFMSDGSFALIGGKPLMGRTFIAADTVFGAPAVVLLGYKVWQRTFNGDEDIVGQVLRVNGRDAEIVGVMPEGFMFPIMEDIWVPLRYDQADRQRGEGQSLEVFGRLKDGVSASQARAEFQGITSQLASAHPETNDGVTAVIKPFSDEYVDEGTRAAIWSMMIAVTLVLLIACANVANLLLSRTTARTQEVAIRAALGAGRRRLVIQMLIESFVLALGGAFIGLALAYWGMDASARFFGESGNRLPFWVVLELDFWSAVFAIAAAGATALLSGLVPALRATGLEINLILRENARGSTSRQTKWLSQSLVVTEIALSFILLVLAGLTIQTSLIMQEFDVGVPVENVLTVRLGLPEADYETPAEQARFFTELNERIQDIRGVNKATVSGGLPGLWSNWSSYLPEVDEVTDDTRLEGAPYIAVANGYFDAFETPLLQGRDFDDRDSAESLPVVIVNNTFATTVFGSENPVGRQVRFGSPDNANQPAQWRTIIGVSQNIKQTGLGEDEERPTFYVPLVQDPVRFMSVALRTSGEPKALAPALRNVVQQLDPELPLYWVQTLEEAYQDEIAPNRLLGICFGVFAVIALLLAAGGLYGVISFNVIQRTPELGIRRALGADDKSIALLVSRQAALQLGLGLGIGILGAVGASQILESVILVSPLDPTIYITVALLLIVSVIIATLVPSRKAIRIEPMAALRYE